MNAIDLNSIFLSNTITYLVTSLLFSLIWFQNYRRFKGLSTWMAFHVTLSFGMFFLLLNGLAHNSLFILFGNVLIVVGLALLNEGFRSFFNVSTSRKLSIGILTVFTLIHFHFTYISDNFTARVINISAVTIIYNIKLLWLSRKVPLSERGGALNILRLSVSFFLFITAVRIISHLFSSQNSPFVSPESMQIILQISTQFLLICVTFSLILIINRRLSSVAEHAAKSEAEKSRELDKLLNEVNCLYHLAQLEETPGISCDEILEEAAKRIVHSWQDFTTTSARIVWNGRSFCSPDFSESMFKESALIRIREQESGRIEIFRKPEAVENGANPFTPEESGLLIEIAARIGRLIEFHQTKEALQQSQRRLSIALGASGMGTWSYNLKTKIAEFNEQALALLGLDVESYDGRAETFLAAVHPDDREKVKKALTLTLEFELPYDVHYRVIWPNQTIRHVTSRGRLTLDEQRKPLRVDGITWDETPQQEALLESQKREERIRSAEKLQAIGLLAGGVAHDFNNMLAGIIGNAELILETAPEGDHTKYTEAIIRMAERSAELSNKLLAFARRGKLQKATCDIHKLVEGSLSLLSHAIDRRIVITKQFVSDDLFVDGDPSQMQDIFVNLGCNACDAMPNGGDLTLITERVTVDAQQRVADLKPGSYISIGVKDTGVGMSKEILNRLFEPFFTTKPQGEGAGLGLAAVFGIVQSHHGAILVESEVGKGSTFRVLLPLADKKSEASNPKPKRIDSSKSATILLIDDENDLRETIEYMLTSMGYEVASFGRARDAIEHYRSTPSDLVILDLMMPDLNGADTFKELKSIDANVRVLISSGFSLEGDAQTLLDNGAAGFLQKPYRTAALKETLRSIIQRS